MMLPWIGKITNKMNKLTKMGVRTLSRKNTTSDRITLSLWGLELFVSRDTSSPVPSELSVIIPRVELRQGYTPGDSGKYEQEIILNSITVVIAPRHAPENPAKNENPAGIKNHNNKKL